MIDPVTVQTTSSARLSHLALLRHGEAAIYASSDHQRPLTEQGQAHLMADVPAIVSAIARQLSETREALAIQGDSLRSAPPPISDTALIQITLEVRVSDARRALETWGVIAEALHAQCERAGYRLNVEIRPELYLASSDLLYRELLRLEADLIVEDDAPNEYGEQRMGSGLKRMGSELKRSELKRSVNSSSSTPLTRRGAVLMYIGHNPGLSEMIAELSSGHAPSRSRSRRSLAPGELACLRLEREMWIRADL